MKFKYSFTLAVVLIILLSLATAAAGESPSNDTSLASDADGDLKDCESQNILRDNPPSGDDTDLSVSLSVENVYHDDKFNRAGYTVPWTVTAKVAGPTARDVKVHVNFSDNMEYVSATPNIGAFNQATGIWDIGDLSSSDNASLLILTKLKADGRFKFSANAQTTSNDINLSNNDAFLKIKSGTGKKPSNTTKTSDQSGGLDDDDSPGSDPNNPFVVIEEPDNEPTTSPGISDGPSPSEKKSDSPSGGPNDPSSYDKRPNSKSGTNGNQGSSSSNGGSSNSNGNNQVSGNNVKSVAKSTMSAPNSVSGTVESFTSIFTGGDSDSNKDLPPSVVKAIAAQDYTKIPLMIFAAFLILLVSFVGYDKIKS